MKFLSVEILLYLYESTVGPSTEQGRRQNLKEVPQNFTEVFNVDDITAKQHRKEKKQNKLEFYSNH